MREGGSSILGTMDPLYDIFFAGQLVDGVDETTARSRLGQLFKANEATLDKLFSGKPMAIKRGLDKAGAIKYKRAMEKAGAVALVRAQAAPEPAPAPPPNDTFNDDDLPSSADIAAPAPAPESGSMADRIAALASEPAAASTSRAASFGDTSEVAEGNMTLAAAGSDVLNEDERTQVESVEVDTSGINLASGFEEPEALGGSTEPALDPDTSHLSMGEVGEDIPHLEVEVEELDPDVSHLSMGEVGEDIPHLETEVEVINPDTSAISLAPEGSDVLEEQYRKHEDASAPSTDHINLENA